MAYYDLDVSGCGPSVARRSTGVGVAGRWRPDDFRATALASPERLADQRRSDLEPYATRPMPSWTSSRPDRVPDRPVEDGLDGLVNIRFRQSPPTRFAEKFGAEIRASDRITMIYNAALVDLAVLGEWCGGDRAVFRPARAGRRGLHREARYYCLCLGGLENPRFLLNANSQMPMGIGNQNDQVGRYFCEHPTYRIADVLFDKETPPDRAATADLRGDEAPRDAELQSAAGRPGWQPIAGGTAQRSPVLPTSPRDWPSRVLGREVDCERDGFFGCARSAAIGRGPHGQARDHHSSRSSIPTVG